MIRSIAQLFRIVARVEAAKALPETELKRARACLDVIQAEHHAELSRLLLELDTERARLAAAERKSERLRQQAGTWRAAAEAAWAQIEGRVGQAVDRRPALRLITRRGPPACASEPDDSAGEDPSPFFWPKFTRYGSGQPVFRPALRHRQTTFRPRLGAAERQHPSIL